MRLEGISAGKPCAGADRPAHDSPRIRDSPAGFVEVQGPRLGVAESAPVAPIKLRLPVADQLAEKSRRALVRPIDWQLFARGHLRRRIGAAIADMRGSRPGTGRRGPPARSGRPSRRTADREEACTKISRPNVGYRNI